MFGQLIEVRGTNGYAVEMRNGTVVEYGMDTPGQQRRLRALGCPEHLIPKVIAKRNRQRNAPSRSLREIDNEIARLNGLLKAKTALKSLTFAERVARVHTAVAKDIADLNNDLARQNQERADEELRDRMEAAAGITNRRRKYQPQ
jgi:hypothetical protein